MNNVSFTIKTAKNKTSVMTYEGLYPRTAFINMYVTVIARTTQPCDRTLSNASDVFDKLRKDNGCYVDDRGNSFMMLNLDQDK